MTIGSGDSELCLQAVAHCHQLIHFCDDALLLGKGR